MLDKAGSATTWKEKFPNALISATEWNYRNSAGQESFKNAFRSLTSLSYLLESNARELLYETIIIQQVLS